MGRGALALAAMMAAGCGDATGVDGVDASAKRAGAPSSSTAMHGTTPGWYRGQTVTFLYNKPYDCPTPPMGVAASGCVLGEETAMPPRGGNDPVLYVITPLGFRPSNAASLHCPVAGDCINHPDDIDVSRIFPDLGAIPLPAHSHIVDEKRGGWWEIEVVGGTDEATWNEITATPSLDKIRQLQTAARVTGDIPTNLFLFFSVQGNNARTGGPFGG
jgi:hypothetical protein